MQFDFDPSAITYEELLEVFFASHDSSYSGSSRQYMSAIFYHDAEQQRAAEAAKAREEKRLGKTIQTKILPAETFYLAEDYHQKYALQADRTVMDDFRRMYSDLADIVHSTAATRANSYLYGYGELEQLKRELDSLGLSEEGEKRLLSRLD